MSRDCFGNATPGIPPSIADTFADIERYRPIPLSQRLEYHYARTDAMIGRGDPEVAWAKLRLMNLELLLASKSAI